MPLIVGFDVASLLVVLVVLALGGIVLRRRVLQRRGGTFDCSLRECTSALGKGWMLGVARYESESLQWHRVFSWSPRPRRVVSRRNLELVSRRTPLGAEAHVLLAGAIIVQCRAERTEIELAMQPGALTGFLSWLESAPPGEPGRSVDA